MQKLKGIFCVLFTLFGSPDHAQIDTFNVYTCSMISKKIDSSGIYKDIYEVNGKSVTKSSYSNIAEKVRESNNILPDNKLYYCKLYTINDILIWEGLRKGMECCLGEFKKYDSIGKLSVTGSYSNCGKKNGSWTYYSFDGDTIKNEIWENGIFISVRPTKIINEVWKFEFFFGIQRIDESNNIFDINEIRDLKIIPYYKGKGSQGIDILITISIYEFSNKEIKQEIDYKNLNSFKIEEFVKKSNPKSGDYIHITALNKLQKYESGKAISVKCK